MAKAPGKSHRQGMSLIELTEMLPDEESAVKWFESIQWPDGRSCGHCGSLETSETPNAKPMPYWCKSCRSYFSVRTGTTIENSRLPVRKWVFAVYLHVTNPERRLKHEAAPRPQSDAEDRLVHDASPSERVGRKRTARDCRPGQVDETDIGGKRKTMPNSKRKTLTGRGSVGKTAVVGARDREGNQVTAKVMQSTGKDTLQGFVEGATHPDAQIYTDDAAAHLGMNRKHQPLGR